MIYQAITLDRRSRLSFDSKYVLSEKEWYSSDEFREAGHIPWEITQTTYKPARYLHTQINSIFPMLHTTDTVYVLAETMNRAGLDSSLATAIAIHRLNIKFEAWTSARGIGPLGYNAPKFAFFFFRKQEDAAMFQMLWG